MLPASARLRNSAEFRAVVRHGVRVGRPTLVIHADLADSSIAGELDKKKAVSHENEMASSVKIGFVVSKKVGNAVTRNRVKRRLRHMAREKISSTENGVLLSLAGENFRVVVRALPQSATHPQQLMSDFSSAWQSSLRRLDKKMSAGSVS